MRIIETKVYTYAELSDEAKAKARDWYREASAGDNSFAEFVTDDFHETLKALGFDVGREDVAWSGFWSQGDGAAFSGTWRASDCDPTQLLDNRPQVYPTENGENATNKENVELHRIAAEILACKAAGMTFANIKASHRGFFMSLDSAEHEQEKEYWSDDERDEYTAMCADNETRFIEAARDLASAFYRALKAECTYQNSNERVAETIEANEYEFTEEGKRV